MQSNILKIKRILFISVLTLLILSCTKKNNLENQITITINSVDGKTKKPRINMFDTIEVRVTKFGFPMKKYVKIAEYITDYNGSVKIKVDSTEEYSFMIGGQNIYGSAYFTEAFSKERLTEGQIVNIEVISLLNPDSSDM